MKKGIVIYGSQYGATEKYAKEIASQLGFDCVSHTKIKSIDSYQIVILGGGHYAGSITGFKKTLEKINIDNTDLIVFTVGLSSKTAENIDAINTAVRNVISKEKVDDSRIFYYRGNMDFKKLSMVHRLMMKFMIGQCKKVPEANKTDDQKGIANLEKQSVDFINVNEVNELVELVKTL
jgi:menaquinone-dependent protoporphyrinogen IX oxidase